MIFLINLWVITVTQIIIIVFHIRELRLQKIIWPLSHNMSEKRTIAAQLLYIVLWYYIGLSKWWNQTTLRVDLSFKYYPYISIRRNVTKYLYIKGGFHVSSSSLYFVHFYVSLSNNVALTDKIYVSKELFIWVICLIHIKKYQYNE